jgi:hypothetical protein
MLHCEARRRARRDADGGYVALADQDVNLWSQPMMAEAERMLTAAAQAGRPGRFQLEAAIQSAHARRARTGRTDWEAIALLYEGLLRCAPAIGARVGHAAALAEARGAGSGLTALDAIPADAVRAYQPYWALRAHLLRSLGRVAEARPAYDRAMGLTDDGAVREFLARERRRAPPRERPARLTPARPWPTVTDTAARTALHTLDSRRPFMTRPLRALFLAIALLAGAVLTAGPAAASGPDDGVWFVNQSIAGQGTSSVFFSLHQNDAAGAGFNVAVGILDPATGDWFFGLGTRSGDVVQGTVFFPQGGNAIGDFTLMFTGPTSFTGSTRIFSTTYSQTGTKLF